MPLVPPRLPHRPDPRRAFPPVWASGSPSADDEEDGTVGLYRAVESEGERELARPATSLWWSGIAAGTCMATSVLATGLLQGALPETDGWHLVAKLGYVTGFLIVVLGRMQLFTENTITTVLPLLDAPSMERFGKVLRLWGIVLLSNLVGAFVAATLLVHASIVSEEQLGFLLEVAREATRHGGFANLGRAVPAGFLIAALVWTSAGAPNARFSLVVALTYLIGIGEFAHVIAGSVEVSLIVVTDGLPALGLVTSYVVPALVGNVIGGTLLFALIAYAQVREELPPDDGDGDDEGESATIIEPG